METPASPYVAVIGGAKVSDKLDVIETPSPCDVVCIGGAMANTFLAKDTSQNSRIEEDKLARSNADGQSDPAKRRAFPLSDLVVAEGLDATDGMIVMQEASLKGQWRSTSALKPWRRSLSESRAKTVF